jgi:ABC-type dipeptide/oligopeptide/nickel transport system ATPase component
MGASGESSVTAHRSGRMRWAGGRIGQREDHVVVGADGIVAGRRKSEWRSVAAGCPARVVERIPPKHESRDNLGKNLVALSEQEFRKVRGREAAMIFQEPMTSLNPVMRVGKQIEEVIRAHYPKMPERQIESWTMESMRLAALPEPKVRAQQ